MNGDDLWTDLIEGIDRRLMDGESWLHILEKFIIPHNVTTVGLSARIRSLSPNVFDGMSREGFRKSAETEVWLALRKWDAAKYRSIENFKNYYQRVMTTNVYRVIVPPMGKREIEESDFRGSASGSLMSEWLEAELEKVIEQKIESFPVQQNDIMSLRAVGLTQEEVAEILHISQLDVSKLEKKCRKELLQVVKEWLEEYTSE